MTSRRFIHPRGVPARVAELSGLPQPVVSNLINGRQRPGARSARALANAFRALGIPIDEGDLLYRWTGRPLNLWPAAPGVAERPAETRPGAGRRGHDKA